MNLPAPSQSEYSFIIAGGGMSGISLAYYLTQSALKDESILLISQDELGYPKKPGVIGQRKRKPLTK